MPKSTYPEITLKKGREKALLKGHPWIFSGAIAAARGNPSAGDIVVIGDASGRHLALGFYNPFTDIALRILTKRCEENISPYFWQSRVYAAYRLRRKIIGDDTNAYRLINAEGDGFPGLIVDVYGDTLVMSVSTAGMEKQKSHILNALVAQFKPVCIYEFSDGSSRCLEGLESRNTVLYGENNALTVEIMENGLRFEVNIVSGQKRVFSGSTSQQRNIGSFEQRCAGVELFRVLRCFFCLLCGRGSKKSYFRGCLQGGLRHRQKESAFELVPDG